MMHFITIVCVMLGVGFFTLFERKCLAYFQTRKGPNKVGLAGLAQPLADALKLFLKQEVVPLKAVKMAFILAPFLSLFLSLIGWSLYESFLHFSSFFWGIFFYVCVCSLAVFPVFMAGWSSASKYGMLGGVRALAQTISYEISFSLGISFFMFFYSCSDFYSLYTVWWPVLSCYGIISIWFLTVAAETHRAPFDFAEGESELVSGYNVEYGGFYFALLFIGEYSFILLASAVCAAFFFGGVSNNFFFGLFLFWIKVLFFVFLFILLRGSMPRLRYDLLMSLVWKHFIPWMTVYVICLLVYLL